ncbi:MAG: Wzz/FepE/Etk N-terminal domain-containing protein, partial [Actinomycetota bacterium]|nr:Wzz/FepE/Etk N-terminal domain-containing protein [Actinomycetota bacterium]
MDGSFHEEGEYGPGLVRSLWSHRWLLVAGAVIGGILGAGLSMTQPTVYQATAQLVLGSPNASALFADEPTRTDEMSAHVLVESERVTSLSVLSRTGEILEGEADPYALEGRLLVTPDVEVSSILVTASGATG